MAVLDIDLEIPQSANNQKKGLDIDLSDKNLEKSSYILILMYKSKKITESLKFRIID